MVQTPSKDVTQLLIDWRDLLLTLAEVAIAITGFSGIIGVLGARGRMERASAEFFKLRFRKESPVGQHHDFG